MSIFPFYSRKAQKGNAQDYLTLDIWDPLESFSSGTVIPIGTGQMDWKETPDAHVYIADLPGVKKDDVKIEVEEEKVLKISGQRTTQSEEKNDKWHRIERYSDKFHRSIKLPANASINGVKAVLDNGVLTVTVPKGQEKKIQGRLIPISG